MFELPAHLIRRYCIIMETFGPVQEEVTQSNSWALLDDVGSNLNELEFFSSFRRVQQNPAIWGNTSVFVIE